MGKVNSLPPRQLLAACLSRVKPKRTNYYNWGNYDASSGECCKMRDCETIKCATAKMVCGPPTYLPNLCVTRKPDFLKEEYPKHLLRLIFGEKKDCDVFNYDACFYKPSDKSRKFQRTWAECPYIWRQPKPVCCFDKDYHSPMPRRPRRPVEPPMSIIDKFRRKMAIHCQASCQSRLGSKVQRKCVKPRKPADCEKIAPPMPSFSECIRGYVPCFCSECCCRVKPTLCDMWEVYNRHNGIRKCTEAMANVCPYNGRLRRY